MSDMLNAEKLLGKIVQEVVGKKGGKKKGRKRKSSSLTDQLTSGAGLMTIIGLGVGAFEILKSQNQSRMPTGGTVPGPFSPSPSPQYSSTPPQPATPPPIPGSGRQQAAPVPPSAAKSVPSQAVSGDLSHEELASRMIKVMIAAAHADGTMDEAEEKAVLDRLRDAGLSQEEKMFLIEALHQPQTIAALTKGITDPGVSKTMYMLAVATIDIDTEAERVWLDQLADQLGLSAELQQFIDEQD